MMEPACYAKFPEVASDFFSDKFDIVVNYDWAIRVVPSAKYVCAGPLL